MMNRNKFVVVLAVLALALASLACNAIAGGGNSNTNSNDNSGLSFTTANITNAHMSRDVNDTDQTNVFAPSDNPIYCFFDLENAPDDTKLKAVWTLVEADGYDSNQEVNTTEYTSGSTTLYFSVERTDAWPVGQYKVDLYIEDNLAQTLTFEVK